MRWFQHSADRDCRAPLAAGEIRLVSLRPSAPIKLRRSDMRTLVGCGSAGAIGAAFGAPLTGAFYAFELIIGTYFGLTVYYAVENENYITVPFLLLFVLGYWYTGLMSLLQGRFSRASLRTTTHTKPFPVGV